MGQVVPNKPTKTHHKVHRAKLKVIYSIKEEQVDCHKEQTQHNKMLVNLRQVYLDNHKLNKEQVVDYLISSLKHKTLKVVDSLEALLETVCIVNSSILLMTDGLIWPWKSFEISLDF